jgi:predicted enzyme related to lactoylglutathione lyase
MKIVRHGALWMVGLSLACSGNDAAGTAQTGQGGVIATAQPSPAIPAPASPAAPAPTAPPVMASPAVVAAAAPAPAVPASSPSPAAAIPSVPIAAMAGSSADAVPPAPAAGTGSGGAATLPRLGFAAFATSNLDASLDFYKTVFKMKELMRIPLGVGMEVVLGYEDLPSQAGLIIMSNPGQTAALEHGNAFSRFIFVVEDINATVKQFQDRDLQVVSAPAAGNGFMYSIVVDPDGYRIELIQYD